MKNKIMAVIALLLSLFAGCNQPKENGIAPLPTGIQYTAEDLFATSDEKTEVTLPDNMVGNQSGITASEPLEESEIPEYLKPQENIEYVKYDAANRYRSPDRDVDLNSMFSIDPDTGVAYFVNQNKDWYIYRIVDGKTELAVELPTRELYVRNGKIYFILEDFDKYKLEGFSEGAVYSYTLSDDSLNMLISAEGLESEIFRIRPYEDGLAFCCRTKEKISDTRWQFDYFYYYYNFADGTLETDPFMRVWPGWENYYQTWNKVNERSVTSLWDREEQEKKQLEYDFRGDKSFIVEDVMYCCYGSFLCVTDLSTGEQKAFDIIALFRQAVPKYADLWDKDGIEGDYLIYGFTVTEDAVWLSILYSYVARLDIQTGNMECYLVEGLNGSIRDLYTDGINLYATYKTDRISWWNKGGTLVRICTDKIVKQDEKFDVPVLAVEHLTE